MGLLDRYRKRRAIRAFAKRLGPALRERFGNTPYYSADQIEDTVCSGKLRRHREYLAYAYCLFMAEREFDALGIESGAPAGFDALRGEAHALIGPGPGAAPLDHGMHGQDFHGHSAGDGFGGGDGGAGV